MRKPYGFLGSSQLAGGLLAVVVTIAIEKSTVPSGPQKPIGIERQRRGRLTQRLFLALCLEVVVITPMALNAAL